jgi:hypothetical protein
LTWKILSCIRLCLKNSRRSSFGRGLASGCGLVLKYSVGGLETKPGRATRIPKDRRHLFADDRGIAITEAVIVIPFFLIVWMGLITMHNMYEKRLEAQVISESRALQISLQGCSGNGLKVNDPDGRVPNSLEIKGGDSSWFERMTGDQPFAWSHTSGQTVLVASGIPELFGGPTREVSGRQKMLCNMRPQKGLFKMLVNMINSAVGGN